MPVPVKMADLYTIAASNSPAGSDPIGNSLDDYLRATQAIIRSTNALASASLAAASTTDLGSADAESVQITGTASITSLGTTAAGIVRECRFTGTPTLVNSSSLVLPGASNITVAAGDVLRFRSLGSGNWVMIGSSTPYGYLPTAGGTMTGTLTLSSSNIQLNGGYVALNATTPNDRYIYVYTNGVARWRFGGTSAAETGSNVGTDFAITSFSDSGTFLATVLTASRNTGVCNFGARPTFNGNLAWDAGNLPSPLDKSAGGTVSGQTTFSGGLSAGGKATSLGNVNLGGQSYASITWAGGTYYVGTNYTNGGAEVDFFNAYSGGTGFNFYKSNGTAFSLLSSLSGAGVWSATDFQSTSDARLKSDIQPLKRGLDELKQMPPREYEKDGRRELGFLAQEVRQVAPEAVSERDDGILTVSPMQLSAILAAAILDIDKRLAEAGI